MRKTIVYQKRASGTDRPAFFQWVRGEQPRLASALPGVRRVVVCLEAEGVDETFDAAIELEFADAASAASAHASAAGERFNDALRERTSRIERVDLVPHPFVNKPPAPFKLMAALKRREDLTRADFKHWWLDKHAPFVVEFPELRRYQVNLVEDGPEAFVDGIAEVCFADLAALQRVMSRAHVKEVQQDSQVHTQARYRMVVEEHVAS